MTPKRNRRLRVFLREETGTASLEFVLVAPLLIAFLTFAVELGMVTLRATMIERGLDIAVRDIRLGTGTAPDHEQIKQTICERAVIIPDCANKLRLEMRPTDIRDFTPLEEVPDCTDAAEPGKPLKAFIPGTQNQLMLMRACLKFSPILPEFVLGQSLEKDTSGDATITASTAFVQEPI